MNFRDCHAKISHVDAQATLGDGVVVQVFGELSNDGHQMRRFTQTFVLACQSPKKYYVHNDIFRYHDIYCEDEDQREELELGTDSTGGASNNSTDGSSTTGPMMVPPPVFYAAPPANVIATPSMLPSGYQGAVVQGALAQAPPQVNGIMHEEMLKNIATQTSQIISVPSQQVAPQVMPMAPAPNALPLPVEPVAVVHEAVIMPKMSANSVATATEMMIQYEGEQSNGEDSDTLDKENDVSEGGKKTPSPAPLHASSASLMPPAKNWANLVKAGPGLGFSGTPPAPDTTPVPQPQSFVAITQQQQQQAQQQKQAEVSYATVDRRTQNRIGPVNPETRERRVSNNNSSISNNNNSGSNVSSDGSSQLFLGNLPTNASEEELRGLFAVFGKIADLRIHTKQTQKGSNGRPVPNYGFITFENPASALRLQEAQPIYYPVLNDKRGTKLNIEHKIRKNAEAGGTGSNAGRVAGDQNNDRGRNSNPGGAGMNRNGSGGRTDGRRDDRNRQFNRSDRIGGGGGQRTTNGNSTAGTYTNTRR